MKTKIQSICSYALTLFFSYFLVLPVSAEVDMTDVCTPYPECWEVVDTNYFTETWENSWANNALNPEPEPDFPTSNPHPCRGNHGSDTSHCMDQDNKNEEESDVLPPPPKGEIDTGDIVSASMSMSCIKWRVVGGCVWYTWPAIINYSIKVKHYIPDYVISVYQTSGEPPWTLWEWLDEPGDNLLESLTGFSPRGGNLSADGRTQKSTNMRFKNTQAIGNPLASVWQTLGLGYLMCQSTATSYMPAFASSLDNLMWRTNPIEGVIFAPLQMIGQQNRITPSNSSFISKWAYLYPRTGFVITTDDLKAAAVTAHRTASIVTSTGLNATTHFAWRPSTSGSAGYWPPQTVKESDTSQGYFQMLLPKMESKCHMIADMGYGRTLAGDGLQDFRAGSGNYAWNFWRPYRCCSKSGKKLIYHYGG